MRLCKKQHHDEKHIKRIYEDQFVAEVEVELITTDDE
jgi:hypothetical protein